MAIQLFAEETSRHQIAQGNTLRDTWQAILYQALSRGRCLEQRPALQTPVQSNDGRVGEDAATRAWYSVSDHRFDPPM